MKPDSLAGWRRVLGWTLLGISVLGIIGIFVLVLLQVPWGLFQ